jgi:predicted dehydrogenase
MKIFCIGAGGIMKNAHLPAYKMEGFEVESIFDVNRETAARLASEFGIPNVCGELKGLSSDVIYDLATPASAIPDLLEKIPEGSFVLMQKPMGETLEQSLKIVEICDRKGLRGAVNFQLRWAPFILAAKTRLSEIGELLDVEIQVNVMTPWALWDFLEKAPRMEMVYHSIHYIDLLRDLLGEPVRYWARSIKHPSAPKLESARSSMYFEFENGCRATIRTYHAHLGGPKHQDSYIRIEGTQGALFIQMGLNLDYPKGGADQLEIWTEVTSEWQSVPFEGSWFPHAYRGPMKEMMRWSSGGAAPSTEVHRSLKTMELVEKLYQVSDDFGASL